MLDLSRRQERLIEQDDYAGLLTVLSSKQRILGRLDDIKRRHPDLLADWRTTRDRIDPADRAECERLLAETEAVVAELIEEERHSTESLIVRRDAARNQLEAIAHGSRVHHAYRDHLAPSTHRHLDVDR
ncbi:MAG: hypothetical protein WD069_15185 [Planctomycetales bacterium]